MIKKVSQHPISTSFNLVYTLHMVHKDAFSSHLYLRTFSNLHLPHTTPPLWLTEVLIPTSLNLFYTLHMVHKDPFSSQLYLPTFSNPQPHPSPPLWLAEVL